MPLFHLGQIGPVGKGVAILGGKLGAPDSVKDPGALLLAFYNPKPSAGAHDLNFLVLLHIYPPCHQGRNVVVVMKLIRLIG